MYTLGVCTVQDSAGLRCVVDHDGDIHIVYLDSMVRCAVDGLYSVLCTGHIVSMRSLDVPNIPGR